MLSLLDHPAVQAGIAPFLVALIVAAALCRTRLAWLGIIAGYATMLALSTGFAFSPLTASRKVTLLCLGAPLVGIAADFLTKPSRAIAAAFSAIAGGLAVWAFISVLRQREGAAGYLTAAGIAVFVVTLVYVVLRLRDDGLRTGAAGLGLGLATGIAAVLSASIGFLASGISIAAAGSALLLVRVVVSRPMAAGFTGALTIGLSTALFASGTLMLAELAWYVLPLLLLIPAAASLPAPNRGLRILRAAVLGAYVLIAAAFPILAAWYAARGSLS